MMTIQACAIPDLALLRKYAHDANYADCYVTEAPEGITFAAYVEAFYTTFLFKLERAALALAARPSTDRQARALAAGAISTFAAWRVEERAEDQLLMCDLTARTRSWFMIGPAPNSGSAATRLCFGSAITAIASQSTGRETIGPVFQALTGFHKQYSLALLQAASAKLRRLASEARSQ